MGNDIIAIVLAGGAGARFGMLKQFVPINGTPICGYTLKKFSKLPIVFAVPEVYLDIANNIVKTLNIPNINVISGGDTRQHSILNALKFIDDQKLKCKNVIITDANRPCLSDHTINSFIEKLDSSIAAVAVCKSVNTSCASFMQEKRVANIYDRTYMYDMLMPQGFNYGLIYNAHKNTTITNATDDAQLLDKNTPIDLVEISYWEGLKLTNAEDYKIFEVLLK